MLTFDRYFECEYSIDVVSMVPSGIPTYAYPGALLGGVVRGVAVVIAPDAHLANKWSATFAEGKLSPRAHSHLGACPDPRYFFVIARGYGYVVNANNFLDWQQIPIRPVMGVIASPKHNLVLFHSHDRVLAWGREGVKWKTAAISFDGIKILGIDEDILNVEVWDAPSQKHVEVAVDLGTGTSEGRTGPGELRDSR